jgi:hypothetical protein
MGTVAAVVAAGALHGASSTGLYILAGMVALAVCWAIVFVINK